MIGDTESDQVLLGSVFDDTRTVQMARNTSPRVYQIESDRGKQNQHQLALNVQKEHELTVVEEDEVAKTHRVNEDWRRQKLLNHMQEDEEDASKTERNGREDDEAVEYPIHSRQ